MIEYPKEIENENQKAWYLRHFLGFTYKQIGKELNRSTSAVHKDFSQHKRNINANPRGYIPETDGILQGRVSRINR